MGKNREKVDIVASILEVAKPESAKTRIMFRANLSFKLLEKYLELLCTAGLLGIQGTTYKVTPEGYDFLKRYKDFRDRFSQAQKMMDDLTSEQDKLDQLFERRKVSCY